MYAKKKKKLLHINGRVRVCVDVFVYQEKNSACMFYHDLRKNNAINFL